MNSITRQHQPKQYTRLNDYPQRFDQTKQTFIDKLKCYQQFADVSKVRQKQEEIKRNAQRIRQKLQYQVRSPSNNNINANANSNVNVNINRSYSLGKTRPILNVGNNNNKVLVNNNTNTTTVRMNMNMNNKNIKTNNRQQQLLNITSPQIKTPKQQQQQQYYSMSSRQQPTTYNNNKTTTTTPTSFTLITTKFTTQQTHLHQQIQKVITQLSVIDTNYSSHKLQHQQASRLNFIQLDNFQKYLITCQKEYQKEYTLVVDRTRQQLSEMIKQKVSTIRNKHKSHLQSTFETLKLIDQQNQLLKNGMVNESELCQSQWCMQLDKINEHILGLNNFITEVRLEEIDRDSDMQWRVKEMRFACEDGIERERKDRLSQEHKIYAVIEQLIQKVALPL